jgi:hypothetical protein
VTLTVNQGAYDPRDMCVKRILTKVKGKLKQEKVPIRTYSYSSIICLFNNKFAKYFILALPLGKEKVVNVTFVIYP